MLEDMFMPSAWVVREIKQFRIIHIYILVDLVTSFSAQAFFLRERQDTQVGMKGICAWKIQVLNAVRHIFQIPKI